MWFALPFGFLIGLIYDEALKESIHSYGVDGHEEIQTTPEKDTEMDIENKLNRVLKYKDLPEEVVFYITEIFPYAQKLFITGVTEAGQTLNLVATEPLK